MAVDSKHPLYVDNLYRWKLVNDVCDGSQSIKNMGVQYLPVVNACATSEENIAYNDSYRQRAVFFEVTKDTLQSHVGLAFSEDPTFEPDGLDFLKNNADGNGKSIYQLNQLALEGLLRQGRGGFFVDFPVVTGNMSQAEIERLNIRPSVVYYPSLNIINWDKRKVGGVYKNSLIVLHEVAEKRDEQDEFQFKKFNRYRVLRLEENNVYSIQVYSDESGSIVADERVYPKKKGGAFFNEIPFIPLGSQVNDFSIDSIPLESLALMNLAHYRNSAEYENSVFICGQIQPVISGLTEEWRDHLEKSGIKLGSFSPLTLPEGGSFQFAQAESNMVAREAMKDKFDYMQALGAKVLDKTTANKTATQVNEEAATQHSVLSLCVSNLNEASEYYLKWCAEFEGRGFDAKFSIKQDFARGEIGLDELKFYYELVVSGDLSKQTFHEIRTTGKVPEIDREKEQARIDSEGGIS